MLSDKRRQMLTEVLDECWHEVTSNNHTSPLHCTKCGAVFQNILPEHTNRTFDCLKDMTDVEDKLKKREEVKKFRIFAWERWKVVSNHYPYFDDWLYTPMDECGNPRFCLLVAEWMENNKQP